MIKKSIILILILVNSLLFISCATSDYVQKDGMKVVIEESNNLLGVIEADLSESEEKQADLSAYIENTVENQNAEILSASDGLCVKQIIETEEGKKIVIDGEVYCENVEEVNRYEYILKPVTKQLREELFQVYFADRMNEVEYDKKNNVWTLNNSVAIGDYYLFTTFYPGAGPTVSGEEAFQVEYRRVNLYPFKDNLLEDVAMSKMKVTLEDARGMCDNIIEEVSDLEELSFDYAHAYGTEGRRPYYKIVYKLFLDNIPVTGYNDLYFLVDDEGIEKICGAVYSVKKTVLEKPILSAGDAIEILDKNHSLVNFEEEKIVFIRKITLEYIVVNSSSGETYITPAWRFCIGDTENRMNVMREKILAVNAFTGDIIQEERGNTF